MPTGTVSEGEPEPVDATPVGTVLVVLVLVVGVVAFGAAIAVVVDGVVVAVDRAARWGSVLADLKVRTDADDLGSVVVVVDGSVTGGVDGSGSVVVVLVVDVGDVVDVDEVVVLEVALEELVEELDGRGTELDVTAARCWST